MHNIETRHIILKSREHVGFHYHDPPCLPLRAYLVQPLSNSSPGSPFTNMV